MTTQTQAAPAAQNEIVRDETLTSAHLQARTIELVKVYKDQPKFKDAAFGVVHMGKDIAETNDQLAGITRNWLDRLYDAANRVREVPRSVSMRVGPHSMNGDLIVEVVVRGMEKSRGTELLKWANALIKAG